MSDAVLRTERLSKHFGGLAAVSEVSLAFYTDQIHAVIGPNGAGKTTLTNLLAGEYLPTSGRILLDGEDVAGLSADRISQRGVGRSYQKTNIFLPFTAFENCRIAAQSRLPSSMRFVRPASGYADVAHAAEWALAEVGLEHCAGRPAAALSHGEQRQLEIAMTLAIRPRILLLDEPLAGMGSEESARMVDLLRKLKRDHAMLLVEHDMDAVFALADRLTVMVNGCVLESGTPEAIRASSAVQEAYLGTEQEERV